MWLGYLLTITDARLKKSELFSERFDRYDVYYNIKQFNSFEFGKVCLGEKT